PRQRSTRRGGLAPPRSRCSPSTPSAGRDTSGPSRHHSMTCRSCRRAVSTWPPPACTPPWVAPVSASEAGWWTKRLSLSEHGRRSRRGRHSSSKHGGRGANARHLVWTSWRGAALTRAGGGAMVDVLTLGEAMAALRPRGPVRAGATVDLSVAGAESNVAIALARLGHRARWVGVVGSDRLGE